MPVAVHSEKIRELVDENAAVEQIATGSRSPKARSGWPTARCTSATCPATSGGAGIPAEGVSVLRDPSNKCNGMTRDNDGNLLVCEHVTSSVVRERRTGRARRSPRTGATRS